MLDAWQGSLAVSLPPPLSNVGVDAGVAVSVPVPMPDLVASNRSLVVGSVADADRCR